MSSVALVVYDVAASVIHFASLLKGHGEDVTLVLVSAPTSTPSIDQAQRDRIATAGIRLLEVCTPPQPPDRWAQAWPARLSERLAPHLSHFQIVYLTGRANPGFHSIRQARFSTGPRPLFVTMLHAPSCWIRSRDGELPAIPEDLQIDFVERYAAQHSDWVVAPSSQMSDWLKRQGWTFGHQLEVLEGHDGSDVADKRWLEFHRRVSAGRDTLTQHSPSSQRPTVDICIPYFNKGRQFPEVLRALTAQTEPSFGVIAVDDGSTDADSRLIFDEAAREYARPGWTFLRQANLFVDAARNLASRLSSADFLLFLDADDVPVPHAIERLLDAAQVSGVDCVLSNGWLMDADEGPSAPRMAYMPLGPDLVGGMVHPIVLGHSMILIRRQAFVGVGGYRECRGAGHEDWELQVRLLLAGYQSDVLPEFLLHFQRPEDGLSRTGDPFSARQRLIEAYQVPLREIGLGALAGTLFQLDARCRELQEQLAQNVPLALRLQLESVNRG